MSRVFAHEPDSPPEPEVTERPVSRHPNLVTAAGLQKMDAQLEQLQQARAAASADAAALAAIERDLRYWRQRRASARVIEPPALPSVVRFGVSVRLRFQDGNERSLRIVGEDEADPADSLVSWTSPVATSLIGHLRGDAVELFGQKADIVELRA
jgi:transcription elongation GreA/GreB family factor